MTDEMLGYADEAADSLTELLELDVETGSDFTPEQRLKLYEAVNVLREKCQQYGYMYE